MGWKDSQEKQPFCFQKQNTFYIWLFFLHNFTHVYDATKKYSRLDRCLSVMKIWINTYKENTFLLPKLYKYRKQQ